MDTEKVIEENERPVVDPQHPIRDESALKTSSDVQKVSTEDDKAIESSGGSDVLEKPLCNGKDLGFLPIPRYLHYQPDYRFSIPTNVAFGFACTFTVANLYFAQPLLIEMAATFGVTYNQSSRIVTMSQAGYATGMLLISPLGDLAKRRELLLVIEATAMLFSIGLAVTSNYSVFMGMSFLVGMFSVTPQVLITLAADLAPVERRGRAISIVLSGLMLGVLCARVISGIIAQFGRWQIVFQMACGLQAAIWILLYLTVPETPAKQTGLSYFQILYTMVKFAVTEPILLYSSLIAMNGSILFSNLWTTLTFLLGAEPYNFNTLAIGLFGLLGIAAVLFAPVNGRLVDSLVPNVAVLIGQCGLLIGEAVMCIGGALDLAAPIIAIFFIDLSQQLSQIANSTRIYGIEPNARARMNAIYLLFVFIGQTIGSSAGSDVFLRYGYRANAGFCMGFTGFSLILLSIRGPHEARHTWFGWKGGHEWRKRPKVKSVDISLSQTADVEAQSPTTTSDKLE